MMTHFLSELMLFLSIRPSFIDPVSCFLSPSDVLGFSWQRYNFVFFIDRNQGTETAMAWLALQDWRTCRIWCTHKLWAAMEKSHKMVRVWKTFEKDISLAWRCFDQNRKNFLDYKPFLFCSKWWPIFVGFQGRRSWKLACSGSQELTFFFTT